jgi:hypothetical protein
LIPADEQYSGGVRGGHFGPGDVGRCAVEQLRPVRDWVVGHRVTDLPRPAHTPQVALKWLVDEWTVQAEMALNRVRVPSGTFRRRLRTELDDALALFEDAGWLAQPRSYHQDPPPLDSVEVSFGGFGPLPFDRLRFASGYEPRQGEPGRERWLGYEANRTAHAWVLRHEGGPRPWLVCVNGYRTGNPMVDMLAFDAVRLHHRLGLNLVFPVSPLHGPRRAGRSGDRVIYAGAMNLVHTLTQGVWDVRRLVSWLRRSGQAPAIGVMGLSLGGYLSALVAAFDDELDGVMLGVPESNLVRGIRRQVDVFLPPFYEQWGLSWNGFERVTRVVSPHAIEPVIPLERRAIFAGLVDRWVRPGNVHDLWRDWGQPAICWYDGSHLSFNFEPDVRRFTEERFEQWGLLSHDR